MLRSSSGSSPAAQFGVGRGSGIRSTEFGNEGFFPWGQFSSSWLCFVSALYKITHVLCAASDSFRSVCAGVLGGVAQSVRACGSYPQCPGFKSLHRHLLFIFLLELCALSNLGSEDACC